MRKNDFADMLSGVWLFGNCSKKELTALASLATQIDVPAGKELVTQGEPGREFFVIVSGKAEATRGGIPIGSVGAGHLLRRDVAAGEQASRGHGHDDASRRACSS